MPGLVCLSVQNEGRALHLWRSVLQFRAPALAAFRAWPKLDMSMWAPNATVASLLLVMPGAPRMPVRVRSLRSVRDAPGKLSKTSCLY